MEREIEIKTERGRDGDKDREGEMEREIEIKTEREI